MLSRSHASRRGAAGEPRRTAAGRDFRDEVVRLHRALFRRNQKLINRSVFGYTADFRRYEREYSGGVRRYQRRARFEELDRAIARAEVLHVGDYHTLAQAQRGCLRLLRRLPPERPVTLALELVAGRHQKALDGYLHGRLSEHAFLRTIHHASRWGWGSWETYKEIFALARRRDYRIIGIDTAGRGPAGASLAMRDRYAARHVARSLEDSPERLVVVLIGELHIAPGHLPAQVEQQLQRRPPRQLVVYQNCQEIYWRLASRGLEQEVELVRVAAGQYCLINTPPIVCQQSFLNWLDADEEGPQLEAPETNFKDNARLIAEFFDLPLGDALEEVEVTTVVDLSFLARLRRRGDFSHADIQQLQRQILRSESYYIPRAKMVYLGKLSVNHTAEEAAHFVRHVSTQSAEPRLLVDAFYARCLEEALGFLGSKIINHKRKATSVRELERLARGRGCDSRERDVARLVLRHLRMQEGTRVRGMSEVYDCDADTFNAVTHVLGYTLGEKLYYALLAGLLAKDEVRGLFLDPLDEEGAALATYLQLVGRTAGVRLPDRM